MHLLLLVWLLLPLLSAANAAPVVAASLAAVFCDATIIVDSLCAAAAC